MNNSVEEKVLEELYKLGWPNIIENVIEDIEFKHTGIDTRQELENLLSKEFSNSINNGMYLISEPIETIKNTNMSPKISLSSRWSLE